ncbi:plasmid pRiA4b ORF-3 family protein [Affinibrenneria salicis]|uniref:Plasmid pRiA4b ORF-3 family protein n=1 Tax=Affinibrenneria salicis TaxID=2590031 RepID=A0A5J5FTJ3_9GAMM|nr:plasmid pRiA4b ORF-3 family protein [Affinibrenneria salicis]KAA8996155.1 plasmid pRiA4b ORF-3 family protein [Affinibrenneria salicis]
MNDKFYQLKITLRDVQPAVWRQFVVPAVITLDRLHDVIQIVMGWQDSHLHEFNLGKQRFTELPEQEAHGEEEADFRLGSLVTRKGQRFSYLYDFGDSWLHELTLENSRYDPEDLPLPVLCFDGAGACPPEDCGGAPGYQNLRAILNDPAHEEYQDSVTWVNELFGDEGLEVMMADRFSVEEVNELLMLYWRWARDRPQPWFADPG